MPAQTISGPAQTMARKMKGGKSFSAETLARELDWRKWFPDVSGIDFNAKELSDQDTDMLFEACVAFMEANLYIKIPGRGKVKWTLRPAQRTALRHMIQNRYTVALKSRQIGFSTLVAGYVLWMTFGYPDRLVIMLSRTERESIKLLLKTKYNYKNMPEWVRERGPVLLDRTRQTMTFDNDSIIESMPSANDPARGESVFCIIVDEWAFLPNPDEAWASIEPVTDIGGRVIGLSTANGEGNFFHKLWLGSQATVGFLSQFAGLFFPWQAVDGRDQAWYDEKKRSMEPWQLYQEYPSNPEEAFIGSGNPVFDQVNLRRFTASNPEVTCDIRLTGKRGWTIVEGGNFSIWAEPDNENRLSYVVGADIAEGLEHGDFTVAQVVCVQTNEVVAVWHGRIEADVFGEEVLPAIGYLYRHAVIAPEVNNHGLTTLKALQRAGYKRIYKRRATAKRRDSALETLGWFTSRTTKPFAIDELGGFLRETPSMRHAQTIAELRSFARDSNGRMGGQPHDDCVMALAIAVQARKYAIIERIDENTDPERIKGSFAFWEKQLDGGISKRSKRGFRPSG